MKLRCPNCGSESWFALETVSRRVYCEIEDVGEHGIEIQMDATAAMEMDAMTSVTSAYMCHSECGYAIEASQIGTLKETQ